MNTKDPAPVEHIDLECPVCGTFEWRRSGQAKDYSVTGEWFELLACPTCELKATYPQPATDKIGRYYASRNYVSHSDTREGLTNKLFHRARTFMLRKKYQWITGATGKTSGRLLDVGAGTGYFAKYMLEQGWDVVALEPDETARKVALDKLDLHLHPLESLATQTAASFDVITLWHVLEHVHDVRGYMDHFRKLLKPGGSLLIAVPNHTSRDAIQYAGKWAAYDVPRHLWHFSPLSVEKLFQKHGFALYQKIAMPLDAFYVSMLSERYKGNYFFGPAVAFISGLKTYLAERKKTNNASSIIYIAK